MPENVKVFTETTCGGCGVINREEGEKWDTLPEGWASLLVVVYGKIEEDYYSYRRIEKTLCPSCLLAPGILFGKEAMKELMERRLRWIYSGRC